MSSKRGRATIGAARVRELSDGIAQAIINAGLNAKEAAIAADAALAFLQDNFGGERLYVPMQQSKENLAKRNGRIKQAMDEGMSVAKVAKRFGITPRTIYNLFPGGQRSLRHSGGRAI